MSTIADHTYREREKLRGRQTRAEYRLQQEQAEAPTHPDPWEGTYAEWAEKFLGASLGWGVPVHQAALGEQVLTSPLSESFVDLEPRGYGKSTTISHALLLFIQCESTCHTLNQYLEGWLSGPNDLRMMHISCSKEKDKRYIKALKRELEENAELIAHYGRILQRPGSTLEYNLKGRVNRIDPTITGAGIGTDIIGWHGDLLVLDDVIQDDKPRDEMVRIKKEEWSDEVLEGCVRPTTKVWWVGTRKSTQDLYQHIMKQPGVTVRLQRAIQEERCPKCRGELTGSNYNQELEMMLCPHCGYYMRLEDVEAVVLWPEQRPYSWLVKKREKIKAFAFSREYQNHPINVEGGDLKAEWLHYYGRLPVAKAGGAVFVGVDPAIGEKKRADYSVIATVWRWENKIYFHDCARGRWTFPGTKEQLELNWKTHSPLKQGIEANFYQAALSQDIIDSTLLPVIEVKSRTDKVERIMSTVGVYAETGRLLINQQLPYLEQFKEEYLDFPDGRHDDILDALSIAIEVAIKPVGAVLFV